MGQIRLTTKGAILLVLALSLISFGLGYGFWKIIGSQYLSPIDSDAAGSGNVTVKCDYDPDACCTECENEGTKCSAQICNDTTGKVSCRGGKPKCDGKKPEGRYHCCDGTWSYGTDEKDACGNRSCDDKPAQNKACWCKSFDGCGVDCSFPAGTAAKVEAAAKNSCGKFMAYCKVDSLGNTKVDIGDGTKCWDSRDVCGNPAAENPCPPPIVVTNTCEGGGLTGDTSTVELKVGESTDFCGYAFDADGIDVDNIVISVDGTAVGKATVTDACTNASDPICTAHAGKKPVKWCYKFTAAAEGTRALSATWKDTKGQTGDACKAQRTVSASVLVIQDNWIADKSAGRMCVETDDPQNPTVKLDYVISITNSATDVKSISKIVDTLDSKVETDYIQLESITPDAAVEGNVITWTLTGAAAQFDPEETKTFKYTVILPKTAFGTYANKAVITPVDSENEIEVSESIIASCDVPDIVPETALLDNTPAKLAVGIFLVLVALAYAYIDPFQTGINQIFGEMRYRVSKKGRLEKSRENFEKRVVS
ncbi:MAG: hypothetical protein UT34_C0001G0394 [candidate division WS6 bacterium GW2011_GWF2_39_15]|uniref:DUF11 domain-containing protein n=1 Tax=candidate division WS6 bacterium GW2011_GWF2_39_15 TaxID=1619100 RepID=A0A0G0MQP6_9BACT|nr:MAG: hypothetical protein UT34_C0001G0394 [candidate division WS6 bacterium GW2011_GWF2_39_15]